MTGAVHAAQDKKAIDVVVLDLRKAGGFTDYFVICTGTNTRQITAIADAVERRCETDFGERPTWPKASRNPSGSCSTTSTSSSTSSAASAAPSTSSSGSGATPSARVRRRSRRRARSRATLAPVVRRRAAPLLDSSTAAGAACAQHAGAAVAPTRRAVVAAHACDEPLHITVRRSPRGRLRRRAPRHHSRVQVRGPPIARRPLGRLMRDAARDAARRLRLRRAGAAASMAAAAARLQSGARPGARPRPSGRARALADPRHAVADRR